MEKKLEPIEEVVIDCEHNDVGKMIDVLSKRRAEVQEVKEFDDKTRLIFLCPARGLIGFQREFQVLTRGTAVMSHVFHGYEPMRGALETSRKGALISMASGPATTYSLLALEPRGSLFVQPGEECYAGMIIGEHSRETDLEVNPVKTRKLTNVRSDGKDDTVRLTPPVLMNLEQAMAWIRTGEMIEVTPKVLRLRMQYLDANARKRAKMNKD